MRSSHPVLFLLIVFLLSTLLSACATFETKASYFNGDVLVEYFQTRQRGNDDSLTMTFYDTGEYSVHFAYTPGKEHSRFNNPKRAPLPEDFTFTVKDAPRVKLITQYVLPGFLDVTITHNDITETHSFE